MMSRLLMMFGNRRQTQWIIGAKGQGTQANRPDGHRLANTTSGGAVTHKIWPKYVFPSFSFLCGTKFVHADIVAAVATVGHFSDFQKV
jgi:hypothetical protein